MILWLTGNSGAGKTTLAWQLQKQLDKAIVLDGDIIRESFKNPDLSEEGRKKHCKGVARLAWALEKQGFDVIVSVIAPYKDLRDDIQEICGCAFLYLYIEPKDKNYPYEMEDDKYYFVKMEDK